jgi:hypothetical protein
LSRLFAKASWAVHSRYGAFVTTFASIVEAGSNERYRLDMQKRRSPFNDSVPAQNLHLASQREELKLQ